MVMNRWLRRFLYLIVVMVWLIVMSLPILAFSLAGKGELQLGEDARLFLIQEDEVEGIGLQWTRPFRQQPSCTRTTVTYLMWEGRSENTVYCQCYDKQTGAMRPPVAQSCNLP